MRWHLILSLALLIPSFELSADAVLIIVPLPGTLVIAAKQEIRVRSGRDDKSGGGRLFSESPVAPKPNPDALGKYHVGDGVSQPKLLYAPDPDYTDAARRKRLQGKVVLLLTVDIDGKTQNVRILHSLSETVSKKFQAAAISLDEKALEVVQQYQFDPALFQGKPVPVETTVEIDYRIY